MNVNCYLLFFYYLGKGDFYFNVSVECGFGIKWECVDVIVNVMNGGICEL